MRGVPKTHPGTSLKLNVRVQASGDAMGLHVDSVDLYSARSRAVFAAQAVGELGGPEALQREIGRELGRVLLAVVQSSSAAEGKTSLMDAVLGFMPEEARIRYSAMTGQSLYYMGQTDLKHRILALAEEEGATRASYALKLLQSDGELTNRCLVLTPGQAPGSGHLQGRPASRGP